MAVHTCVLFKKWTREQTREQNRERFWLTESTSLLPPVRGSDVTSPALRCRGFLERVFRIQWNTREWILATFDIPTLPLVVHNTWHPKWPRDQWDCRKCFPAKNGLSWPRVLDRMTARSKRAEGRRGESSYWIGRKILTQKLAEFPLN